MHPAAAHLDGRCSSHAEQPGDVVIEASAMPVDPAAPQQRAGLLADLSNTGAEKQQSLWRVTGEEAESLEGDWRVRVQRSGGQVG